MITTVTLNPMLDKTVIVDKIERGKIHRAMNMEMVPGGKGINVSRQSRRLGMKTLATGFLGGETGTTVSRLMSEEGIEHDFVWINAMTRDGVTYRENDGTTTAIFEPSQKIGLDDAHALSRKAEQLAPKSTWLVCAGSSPCSEADDLFFESIRIARDHGVRSVLDSYGRSFERALTAVPTLVKPNRQEFEKTFGAPLNTERSMREGLEFFLSRSISYALITDGARPFYAAGEGKFWVVMPPSIKALNPVGSGDAMVAGILYGLEKQWEFARCLTFGTAAGAANAQKWGIANSALEEIQNLESEVRIKELK
ncbi:MAG: 1-phosphofructokinase family hexose kinase [bacterium]